jgi:uncharacterized membrane protein
MARSDLIHNYLSELEIYLSRVSEARAQEVVQEIESHIYDSLAAEPQEGAVEAILGRLGTARELAAGYVDHITIGVAPPKGLKPLSRIKKGVSKSLYYLVGWLGYSAGLTLIFLAVLKLVSPSSFGVWIAEHGNSVVISFSQTDLQANELSALWLIPAAAFSGSGLLYLTRQICRILKMHI